MGRSGRVAAGSTGRLDDFHRSKRAKRTERSEASMTTVPGSSPLLVRERFRRPTSPVHTEAFQVG